MVNSAFCPSDQNAFQLYNGTFALSNYFGNEGTRPYPNPGGGPAAPYDGVLFMGGFVRFKLITDGLSKTLLLGERGIPDDQYWGWLVWGTGDPGIQDSTGDAVLPTQNGLAPGNSKSPADTDVEHYWSYHPGGAQFAFVDGSVQFLNYDIDFTTFTALGTRTGRKCSTRRSSEPRRGRGPEKGNNILDSVGRFD